MEITLAESSTHTPIAEEENAEDARTDAISTPQPPAKHMRFDTLREAENTTEDMQGGKVSAYATTIGRHLR